MEDTLGHEKARILLLERLLVADILESERLHSFKELLADASDLVNQMFYEEALEELKREGLLDESSHAIEGGDAMGRLSQAGRDFVRHLELGGPRPGLPDPSGL